MYTATNVIVMAIVIKIADQMYVKVIYNIIQVIILLIVWPSFYTGVGHHLTTQIVSYKCDI
jgi:hypothetical protein